MELLRSKSLILKLKPTIGFQMTLNIVFRVAVDGFFFVIQIEMMLPEKLPLLNSILVISLKFQRSNFQVHIL